MYYPNTSYLFRALFVKQVDGVCRYTVFMDEGIITVGDVSQYTEKVVGATTFNVYSIRYPIDEICAGKDITILFEYIVDNKVVATANQQVNVQPLEDYKHSEDIVDYEGIINVFVGSDEATPPILNIYKGNNLLKSIVSTASGNANEYGVTIDTVTLGLSPSVTPYNCVWRFERDTQPISLWVINPSIYSVLNDLRQNIDRLHQQARLPELEYGYADYMRWLKLGMDMFNGTGLFTSFNMTNATSIIRHWWLVCSTIQALSNQYLVEGRKSFSFNGQSVTLDVDITSFLQGRYSELEGAWEGQAYQVKDQLKNYDLNGGDGNADVGKFVSGVVGVSLGPASQLGSGVVNNSYALRQMASIGSWYRNTY